MDLLGLLPSRVREALEEAACEAESGSGQGFVFSPVVYREPARGWLTPYMMANDLQQYLDASFGDEQTRIPKGV
jgi:hypothetical protein